MDKLSIEEVEYNPCLFEKGLEEIVLSNEIGEDYSCRSLVKGSVLSNLANNTPVVIVDNVVDVDFDFRVPKDSYSTLPHQDIMPPGVNGNIFYCDAPRTNGSMTYFIEPNFFNNHDEYVEVLFSVLDRLDVNYDALVVNSRRINSGNIEAVFNSEKFSDACFRGEPSRVSYLWSLSTLLMKQNGEIAEELAGEIFADILLYHPEKIHVEYWDTPNRMIFARNDLSYHGRIGESSEDDNLKRVLAKF